LIFSREELWDLFQEVLQASDIIQDGNKDFVGELSVTLVDARKLSFVLFGKRTFLCKWNLYFIEAI